MEAAGLGISPGGPGSGAVVMTSMIPLAFASQIPRKIRGLGPLNACAVFPQMGQESASDRHPAAYDLTLILLLLQVIEEPRQPHIV